MDRSTWINLAPQPFVLGLRPSTDRGSLIFLSYGTNLSMISTVLTSSWSLWNRVSSQEKEERNEGREEGRKEGMGEVYRVTSLTENDQLYMSWFWFCPSSSLAFGSCFSSPRSHQKTLTVNLRTSGTLLSGKWQFPV